MKINWKVRAKNKTFWLSMIPAALLLTQVVAAVFGVELNFSALQDKLIDVVNAAFVVLALLGIVVDHTTEGVSDSAKAMTYVIPNQDGSENAEMPDIPSSEIK